MDERAARLLKADEEDLAIDSAKSANLGATAIMCRWRDQAKDSLGENNDITKHYQAQLDILRIQLEMIRQGNQEAIAAAHKLSNAIKTKYGDIKKGAISKEDHIRKFQQPDGPR